MASLLELAQIEANSLDPGSSSDPAVISARNLRLRLRMLMSRKAYNFMSTISTPDGQEQLEFMAFAQRILRSPDSIVDAALRIILAQAPLAATTDEILASGDATLDAALTQRVLANLARGLQLSR